MLAYLLAAITAPEQLCSPDIAGEKAMLYRAEEIHAPIAPNAYQFQEHDCSYGSILEDPISRKGLGGSALHQYELKVVNDIAAISFANISIPLHISDKPSEWISGQWSCYSSHHSSDPSNVLVIICQSPQVESPAMYKFEFGRGITGFFGNCFYKRDCWFQLASDKGLFAKLPLTDPTDTRK